MSHREREVAYQIRGMGYRMTPQRQLVLDTLCEQGEHLSANEIYAAVHEQAPALSRATVYRTLQFLCDLQLVTRTEISGLAVYELAQETPHHHLVCRICGKVLELPDRYFEPLAERLLDDLSFHAEIKHMAISGICADCRDAEQLDAGSRQQLIGGIS